MNDKRSYSKMDDKSSSNDSPPMSRLFIICNKGHTEEDFQNSFEKYGHIEDIWVVKDKQTGDNKGVAYVKFSKTSEAALALEELNGKCIGDSDRPIKVLVAASRTDGSTNRKQENESEKYVRLFVVVPKTMDEEELAEVFDKYGDVEKVQIVRDKLTKQPKGVAYVRFHRFLHAAIAYESCPAKYKAVFANPKAPRNQTDYPKMPMNKMESGTNFMPQQHQNDNSSLFRMQNNFSQPTSLNIICSNLINQDQLWRLFDVIPGLDYCQINGESGQNCNMATVVYTNPESAHYAKEKLHGLEYPPGHRLIIKPSGDSVKQPENCNSFDDMGGGGRSDSLCSVSLPPPAPMADSNAEVAKRCFIVVSSQISDTVLKHVFCSFGNLIEVYLLPNRNCGYAKYATQESAEMAMETLNGAEICGVRVKVIEAEEPKHSNRKRMRRDD